MQQAGDSQGTVGMKGIPLIQHPSSAPQHPLTKLKSSGEQHMPQWQAGSVIQGAPVITVASREGGTGPQTKALNAWPSRTCTRSSHGSCHRCRFSRASFFAAVALVGLAAAAFADLAAAAAADLAVAAAAAAALAVTLFASSVDDNCAVAAVADPALGQNQPAP
eukprot:1133811-Pelagomonas_calceolata.AAC.3